MVANAETSPYIFKRSLTMMEELVNVEVPSMKMFPSFAYRCRARERHGDG